MILWMFLQTRPFGLTITSPRAKRPRSSDWHADVGMWKWLRHLDHRRSGGQHCEFLLMAAERTCPDQSICRTPAPAFTWLFQL